LLSATLLGGCAAKTHAYLRPDTPFSGELDPSLLGERWQMVLLPFGVKLGYLHTSVKPAAPGTGALLERVSEGVIKIGETMETRFSETQRLDGQLSQVYRDYKERTRQAKGEPLDRSIILERKEGGWLRTLDGARERVELDLPIYDPASNLPLLLRRLPLAVGKSWSFQNLKWDRRHNKAGAKAQVTTLRVDLPPEGSGAALAVVVGEGGEDTALFLVDAQGRISAHFLASRQRLLITSTKEEALSETQFAPKSQMGDPRYPVKVLMALVGGFLPAKALDAVVDWERVYKKAGDVEAQPSLEAFVSQTKREFTGMAAGRLDSERIQGILDDLSVVERPDGSILLAPEGSSDGFQVAKLEGRWLLVALP